MTQTFITIAIPFDAAQRDDVERRIEALGNPATAQVRVELDSTEVIHFMSMHAVRAEPGAPAHLVLELAVDGGTEQALLRLLRQFGTRLSELLESAGITVEESDLLPWLQRHTQPVGYGLRSIPGLNFSGAPGMTVARIKREAQLARRVTQHLCALPLRESAAAKLEAVRARLWHQDKMRWAFDPRPSPFTPAPRISLSTQIRFVAGAFWPLVWPLVPVPLMAAVAWLLSALRPTGPLQTAFSQLAIAGAVITGLEVALAAGVYAAFRRAERSDPADARLPSALAMQEVMQREDVLGQNHLLVLSTLKPGLLRRLSLRLAFSGIAQGCRLLFAPGQLSDIGSIHFARWILLPGTSQLLFFSNYGGSWESYLEDFINKAHEGLTAVWSNTLGFPRARNLIGAGARDGARFKAWARRHQVPTAFWYCAYPDVTTARIRANAAITRGIAAADGSAEAEQWLANIVVPLPDKATESAPAPVREAAAQRAIESEDVPTLVFGGLPALGCARAFMLRLPADVERSKRWLAELEPYVTHGEKRGRSWALALAFTADGLRKLGLGDRQLATFPVAFQHGSAARARALGDVGKDAPHHWWWGAVGSAVDAIVLLYAVDESTLTDLENDLRALPHAAFDRSHGITLRKGRRSRRRAPEAEGLEREPFGFVDGVSQPVIRGTSRHASGEIDADQVLEPGEIILGYRDGLGYYPPTPLVDAGDDPANCLAHGHFDQDAPWADAARDLGRNGSFLVVRQLEQHVDRFERFLDEVAPAVAAARVVSRGVDPREWVAAKMLGRWRNGSSLVENPTEPGPRPDNAFRFGRQDGAGLRCPFGAHIRRANPRDSFSADDDNAVAIVNRHRILRVGRVYEPPSAANSPGLLFMCLNADIERQFEFVQQTWMRSPSFHGLQDEADPVVIQRCPRPNAATPDARVPDPVLMSIPTERGPLFLKGIADFVTVRGSGYFFMPGRRGLQFLATPGRANELLQAAE